MDFGNFEVPGTTVLAAYSMFMLAIVGVIFWMKNVYRNRSNRDLKQEFDTQNSSMDWASRNKYPSVDAFRLGRTFFNFGLFIAISMVIFAFGWTQYDYKVDIPEFTEPIEDIIDTEIPRTPPPLPPPPPPPPPTKLEILPDEEVIDTVTFVDQSIKDDTPIISEPVEKATAPPPTPPPPPIIKEEMPEIFKVVEEMPMFKGCESVEDKKERKTCAEQEMLQFVYKNIKYPAIARENGVDGMVVIQFVINEDGSISNAEIVRDIGAKCGEEALRVIKKMPNWNPGKQRGRPVKVQFNLPVKFQLQ